MMLPASPAPWRRRLLFLAALAGLFLAAWFFRAPLLTGFAKAWIVDDVPAKSDVIVILGGGVEYRPFTAARLYREGFAPKVLIMDVSLSPTEEAGLKPSERDLTRRILAHEGVPDTAVEAVGRSVKNTFDESVAVRDWAATNGTTRLLIVTELFHTRRVRWLFHKRFKGTPVEIRVVAAAPYKYQVTNWWQHEEGLINFQNEWIKLPYYWLKY